VFFSGYHATSGVLRTGPVTLGSEVFVSETSVLDIDTTMGDRSQLGHSSSLRTGQSVPAGERRHGVPAQPTSTNYRVIESGSRGTLRRFGYGAAQGLGMLMVLSAVSGALITLLTAVPRVTGFFQPSVSSLAGPAFYLSMAAVSAVVFFGGVVLWLAAILVLPRC
jgi:non-ribosomal peptide synthetase-like protein